MPLGAAMLAPLAAAPLQGLVGRRTRVGRRERGALLGGAALALVVLAVAVPRTSADPPALPRWADPAMGRLPAGTKVLNDWDLGGYLMWRYPRLDLVMHGYGDTFTAAELDRNNRLLLCSPGWERDLRATGARVALLRPWSRLAHQLESREQWSVVHVSDSLEMLRAPHDWRARSPSVG